MRSSHVVWLDFSSQEADELTRDVGNAHCMAHFGDLFSAHDVDRREQLPEEGVAAQRSASSQSSAVTGTRLSQTSAAHQDPNNKSTHHSIVCNALLCDMWFQEHHCLLLDWEGGRMQLGGAYGSNTGKWCRSETGSYGHCMQWSAA